MEILLKTFLISTLAVVAHQTVKGTVVVPGGKNILVYVGITTLSHRMAIWPLLTRLADEGHNLTFMSGHSPPKFLADPRIHELVPEALAKFNKKLFPADLLKIRLKGREHSQTAIWEEFPHLSLQAVASLVQDPNFLMWYEAAQFDLVMTDALYCDLGLALASKFKARTALIVTSSPYMWQMDAMGVPVESWVPDVQLAFLDQEMTFLQKVVNVLMPIYWTLFRKWSYFPRLETILRQSLPGLTHMPGLAELEKNVSLFFVNTHFGEEYARSVPPNFISIGGLHCGHYEEKRDLGELGTFMENSGHGFIYLSFGSAAAVSEMPEYLQKIFFDSMQKFEINFLVKWEDDFPPPAQVKSKNIFFSRWLPQQNVLGHKNIKGFITHGGLLGIQEAVCSGVPLIVLPMVADQDFNANRIERRGIGLKLDWSNLSEEVLSGAISKILSDSSYTENMQKTSKIFLDQPATPIETASWWVNYILRHGEHMEALQPLGIHQTWYERRLLDVWAFVAAILVSVLVILFKFTKIVFWALAIPTKEESDGLTVITDQVDMNNNDNNNNNKEKKFK